MTEDAKLVTGFGGQLTYLACPTKIMTNSETQNIELLNFIKRIVKEVNWSVHQAFISDRQSESVRVVRIERLHSTS